MASAWQLGVLLLTFSLVAAEPLERERRLLLDTFKTFFGPKLPVKDKDQATLDADAVRSFGHQLATKGNWLGLVANDFRISLYALSKDRNFDKWKTAAAMVTTLGDALLHGGRTTENYNLWIKEVLTGSTKDGSPKEKLQEALDITDESVSRIEQLVPGVSQALTELRDVTGAAVRDDVEETLGKVKEVGSTAASARQRYEKLVESMGLEELN